MTSVQPTFAPEWQRLVDRAANALRALALNEEAKARFCSDPLLRSLMHRVSRRYIAGTCIADAAERIADINRRGHAASAEYMGESCREEGAANAATDVFLSLIATLNERGLNSSASFDLSHVGSLIDPDLGYRNALRLASAAAEAGRELMISMESSDRVDDIFRIYRRLHEEAGCSNVGITVAARLHRTADDLPELLKYPGRIRLVKGAYFEPESIAYSRNSEELAQCYRAYAKQLLTSGHKCSIATHDRSIQNELTQFISERGIEPANYEFESLIGLGTQQIDDLRQRAFPTREYAVFGEEHFLYVLNRIAEEPIRVYQALVDLLERDMD